MAFKVTTTSVPVALGDLGGYTIPHPTSGLDLEGIFSLDELRSSANLKAAMLAGLITAQDGDNYTITAAEFFDSVAENDVAKFIFDYVGKVNGVATLDSSGKVPGSQLTDLQNFPGVLPINKGGTGQITAGAGFDALAPTTTKGDLIVRGAASNVRLPVGLDGQVPVVDSAQATGWRFASISGSYPRMFIEAFTSFSGTSSLPYVATPTAAAPVTLVAGQLGFPGSSVVGSIASISALVSISIANVSGEVEIYDITNAKQIAILQNITNVTAQLLAMTVTAANIPAGPAIFEVRVKKLVQPPGQQGNSSNVRLHSLTFVLS